MVLVVSVLLVVIICFYLMPYYLHIFGSFSWHFQF